MKDNLITIDSIQRLIHLIRNQKVIFDIDLAAIYEVDPRTLIQAIKRNQDRFPADFAFQLTKNEEKELLEQTFVQGWGGRRHRHYVFTEHGTVMAANVLRSERAVKASIYVVRAFVRLKQFIASHKELAQKLDDLERQLGTHDKAIVSTFQAIRKLMSPTQGKRKKVGFIW
ncbi:MAG: ORF6N domain-containing protein [Patescibacteria group bacterium]